MSWTSIDEITEEDLEVSEDDSELVKTASSLIKYGLNNMENQSKEYRKGWIMALDHIVTEIEGVK